MFRAAIRTAENRKEVAFYLFYKRDHVQQLQEAIRKRYCGLLGGKLELVSEETISAYKPVERVTASDRIIAWFENWDGEPKKRAGIIQEIGISLFSFKTEMQRNAIIKELFAKARKKAQEKGLPVGWYAK